MGSSPNIMLYSRAVYTLLDLLGDVGGLTDALKLIGSIVVAVLSDGGFSNYLISKLFYKYKKDGNAKESNYMVQDYNLSHAQIAS